MKQYNIKYITSCNVTRTFRTYTNKRQAIRIAKILAEKKVWIEVSEVRKIGKIKIN